MKTLSKCLIITMIALFATGCGKQPDNTPNIPGLTGPTFNVLNGSLLVSFEFANLEMQVGARIPINGMANSFLEFTPAQSGGTLLQASLDLKDIENGDFSQVDPQTLPGGRALPGIAGGELPSIAVQIPKLQNSTVYVSKQIFGFFLPIEFKVDQAIVTYRLNMDGKFMGNMSLVGRDAQGENSGFLMLLNLSLAKNGQVKALIEHSKKAANRNKLY